MWRQLLAQIRISDKAYHSRNNHKRRIQLTYRTRLCAEQLEARLLLAHDFLRTDGLVITSADGIVTLERDSPVEASKQDTDSGFGEVSVHSTAEEEVSGGDRTLATAEFRADAWAAAITPIDATTFSPSTSAAGAYVHEAVGGSHNYGSGWFHVEASAVSPAATNAGSSSAQFTFRQYDEEQYELHGFLSFGGSRGTATSGNGGITNYINLYAAIFSANFSAWVSAEANPDGTWDVTGYLPGIGDINDLNAESLEGYPFVVEISDDEEIVFNSSQSTEVIVGAPEDGDSAMLTLHHVAAAFAYAAIQGHDLRPGDFNGDGEVDGGDYDIWSQNEGTSFGAILPQGDADQDGDVDEDDYLIWLENAAPKVSNVTISSTVANPYGTNPPYSFDTVVGSEEQLRTVPVGGANQLAIQFTKDVDISSGDLDLIALNRVVNEPSVSSFTPPDISNDFTATWTFASTLPGAQYLVRLSDSIEDLDGNALDGEWTNPGSLNSSVTTSQFPSGDHYAGGDFEFVFTYLPGDANRDNAVDNADFAILGGHYEMGSHMAWGNADFTGDGAVDASDFAILAGYYGLDHWKDLLILGDYDSDFDLDNDDETDFLTYYSSQNSAADLNGSNSVTQADFDAFYDLLGFGIELDILT